MYRISELRLKNVMQHNGSYVAVNNIHPGHFYCKAPSSAIFLNSLRDEILPVQLTPELLTRFGFKTGRAGVEWSIITDESVGSVLILQCINGKYCISCFPREFDYVHELQNIYHALVGKELKTSLM